MVVTSLVILQYNSVDSPGYLDFIIPHRSHLLGLRSKWTYNPVSISLLMIHWLFSVEGSEPLFSCFRNDGIQTVWRCGLILLNREEKKRQTVSRSHTPFSGPFNQNSSFLDKHMVPGAASMCCSSPELIILVLFRPWSKNLNFILWHHLHRQLFTSCGLLSLRNAQLLLGQRNDNTTCVLQIPCQGFRVPTNVSWRLLDCLIN